MSEILCKWLNQELQLSKAVEPKTFAKDFSSGYLIGEVLHKYRLQNDFSLFMKKDTSIAKVNNFTRLEPTLRLLGISLNINTAKELMEEKQGVATHLLHQLYASLEKKKITQISRKMMEMKQSAASEGPHTKEHDIYSNRQAVKHDAELKLQKISQHYQKTRQQLNDRSIITNPIQQRRQQVHDEKRIKNTEKKVQTEIAQTNRKKRLVTSGFASSSSFQSPLVGSSQGYDVPGSGTKLTLQSNCKYIQEIQQRLRENATALERREKRRDRFLMQQLEAREAQEVARHDEQLVKRLTRQTRQEQRLATQLLQIRIHVPKSIRENHLFREQQYQERRKRDFEEALQREAILAQHAKLVCAEEVRKELEFLTRISAERAQTRYLKHFTICKGILEQIVDLTTNVGEYRLLTENLIPDKLVREWKELMFSDLPLCEPIKDQQPDIGFSTPLDPVELEKQEIQNNQDYDEYTNMVGEWTWPEEAGATKVPPTNNNILGHVVLRLRNIVHPPVMKPSPPSFPDFTLKACVLGKFCSGKTACLAKIAEAHGIYVLSADTLVKEALNAYQNGEENLEVTERQAEKTAPQLTSSTSLQSDLDTQEESRDRNIILSTRAVQGAAAEKELRKSNIISNELLLDIIVEAIRQVPAQSGWILDGFPEDINQAYLLEKALGGSVDIGNDDESSRLNLATAPNPPKPPPPPAPVLDLALLLDIPDESVVRRAYSHTRTHTAAATSYTTEQNLYLGQIPHRITAFQDAWPKLEKWFGEKQNVLVRIDANVEEEELYNRMESVLQQVLLKRQEGPSTYSETNEDFQGVPEHPPKSACPCPGSSSWVYVDDPLSPEIPEYLCSYWDSMCDSYVNNIKTVMQQLRSQRNIIIHHLFNIRERFKHYLGRPDVKQELVSQWQKDFNSMSDDMREDEDTKAELHLRLDELLEHLRDISNKRKEQDEQERAALMCDGWMEDHTAILINHHSILIQVELDRFQETLCILKVYYSSMYRQVMPKPPFNFVCFPLLNTPEIKDQDKSVPLHYRRPDSYGGVSKTKHQGQTEPVKLPHEKLISDYEEAVRAISKLVSAEAHLGEIKKQKKSDGANDKNTEVSNKIQYEYAAALDHEENAAKVRIALVKGHGLVMEHSLQSRAEQTFSNMETWLEAQHLAEMKSIEQLSDVVRHHIETGAKLQNELVVECADFYLNGDCHMVASPVPPPRPPPLEKSTGSTLTITQLETLHQLLSSVAPSGLMSSLEFFRLLRDITSVKTSRDILPEPWINKNETQLMEIMSTLTDNCELIDWRRFLLSAALPWPFPSLTELLVVLQCLKAADTDNIGYINEEQYLQTELWFSSENAQPIPEDHSEPLPYDRLANLRKFFFHLFADHSFSPPQLDYVSMLLYFAADPNPRQGFIRALSVVLGKRVHYSSPDQLVKSMPSTEAATELISSEHNGDYKEEGTLCASSGSLGEQEVSVLHLLAIICHKATKIKDCSSLPPDCLSQEEHTEHLVCVFRELGYKPEDCVPFSILSLHPFIQGLMETSTHYQLMNIHKLLLGDQDEGEATCLTVS